MAKTATPARSAATDGYPALSRQQLFRDFAHPVVDQTPTILACDAQ
jgi:hypothetical protein